MGRAAGRIVGVDLARMVALLGMYAAHLVSSHDPDGPGGVDLTFQVVAGRSSALFAVLAGVGIVLAVRTGRGARASLLVRAALVALIGLALGELDSGLAVILTFYGLLFACALPVLRWSARALGLLAVAWGTLSPVVSVLLRRELEPVAKIVPSFGDLGQPLVLAQELLVTGYYPVLTWATYLFAGMAIGRLDLRRTWVAPRLALAGAWLAALALGVSALVLRSGRAREALLADAPGWEPTWEALDTTRRLGLYGTHPDDTWWWLGVWSPHSGSIVDLAHTVGTAMLVLGLALWLTQLVPAVPWRIVAGAGAMTLTLYAMHVAVLASPLGERGPMPLAIHAVASVALGAIVAASGVRGPLEAGVGWAAARVRRATPAPEVPTRP